MDWLFDPDFLLRLFLIATIAYGVAGVVLMRAGTRWPASIVLFQALCYAVLYVELPRANVDVMRFLPAVIVLALAGGGVVLVALAVAKLKAPAARALAALTGLFSIAVAVVLIALGILLANSTWCC